MTVPPPPGFTPPPPPVSPTPGMPPLPPTGPVTPNNGPATTSMILGIISMVCLGLVTGIPAIIFGVIGKKKANEMNGTGSGQAVAGLVLGIIGTVWSLVAIVIFILAAASADSTVSDINREIKKSQNEYKKSQSEYEAKQARTGDLAKASDYEITAEEQDVDYGYATYSAYIENTADFETGFKVKIRCEGNLGDVDTETTNAYSLAPGGKENLYASFSFDSDTTSVACEVTEVRYDY